MTTCLFYNKSQNKKYSLITLDPCSIQQDAANVKSILLPSVENKRTIVLAVVAFCCIQEGVCEMHVRGRVNPFSVGTGHM